MRVVKFLCAGAIYAVALSGASCGDDSTTIGSSNGSGTTTCPFDECAGECVDTSKDIANCGACGTACNPGEVCSAGACALSCQSDLTECGGTCTNTDIDPSNCGACGTTCDAAAGEICNGAGMCARGCQQGLVDCNGTCVDPNTNEGFCGASGDCMGANAGTICADGEVCDGTGVCALTCQTGLIDCNGTCIDPNTDEAFCGASGDCLNANAGTVCGSGEICDGSGVCALSCQSTLINCNGTCIDPNTEEAYCGASGDCLNANSGTVCGPGEICNGSGVCALSCQTSLIDCNGTCIDPNSNPTYCGATANCVGGTTCQSGEACVNGVCLPLLAQGSCLDILNANLSTGDGVYTIDPNNNGGYDVYCDMTNGGWTYEVLGFGQYNVTYPNYTLMTVTDMQSVQVQQAFIWAYNNQTGLQNLNPGWSSNNCCFKNGTAADSFLRFGTSLYLYPADFGATTANCNGTYSDPIMRYWFANSGPVQNPPLPANYFTTNPVAVTNACSDSNNPGFFFLRYQ